jgi:hypothetical protein
MYIGLRSLLIAKAAFLEDEEYLRRLDEQREQARLADIENEAIAKRARARARAAKRDV